MAAGAADMLARDATLLVIDVQEKLLPQIPDRDALVRNVAFLIDAARLPARRRRHRAVPEGPRPDGQAARGPLAERPDKIAFSCCARAVVERFRREAAAQGRAARRHGDARLRRCSTALDLLDAGLPRLPRRSTPWPRGSRIDHDMRPAPAGAAGAILDDAPRRSRSSGSATPPTRSSRRSAGCWSRSGMKAST